MNLGFDIDGIVADMFQAMIDKVNEKYGLSFTIDVLTKDEIENIKYVEDEELNKQIIHTMIDEVIKDEEAIRNIQPYDDSINHLKILKEHGHKLYFITARFKNQKDATIDWFTTHDVPFDGIYVVGGDGKGKVGKELALDFFIDDNVYNLKNMFKYKKDWSYGLALFDRPWNQDSEFYNNFFVRMKDWPDVLKHLGIFSENKNKKGYNNERY